MLFSTFRVVHYFWCCLLFFVLAITSHIVYYFSYCNYFSYCLLPFILSINLRLVHYFIELQHVLSPRPCPQSLNLRHLHGPMHIAVLEGLDDSLADQIRLERLDPPSAHQPRQPPADGAINHARDGTAGRNGQSKGAAGIVQEGGADEDGAHGREGGAYDGLGLALGGDVALGQDGSAGGGRDVEEGGDFFLRGFLGKTDGCVAVHDLVGELAVALHGPQRLAVLAVEGVLGASLCGGEGAAQAGEG